VAVGARRKLAAMLHGVTTLPGVSARMMRGWKEDGGPLTEMALWVRERPEDLGEIVAYLRGLTVPDPADFEDAVMAEQAADAAEDMAQTVALMDPQPVNLLRYATASELAASRSIEAARAARERAGMAPC
jgi:hypothetical protein